MRVTIEHDYDCPLGSRGLEQFSEATDALSSTPPEARATIADKRALAQAWVDLLAKHHCTCGALEEIKRREEAAYRAESSATL